jgi:hypothetical protein
MKVNLKLFRCIFHERIVFWSDRCKRRDDFFLCASHVQLHKQKKRAKKNNQAPCNISALHNLLNSAMCVLSALYAVLRMRVRGRTAQRMLCFYQVSAQVKASLFSRAVSLRSAQFGLCLGFVVLHC